MENLSSDNFNYICADCGPCEGDSFYTAKHFNDFCESCWKNKEPLNKGKITLSEMLDD